MKIRSAREHKNDLSDIVGILNEEQKKGNVITYEQILQAYTGMYNSDQFPDSSKAILEYIQQDSDLQKLYNDTRSLESDNKQFIAFMNQKYLAVLKEKKVSQIIEEHNQKRQK